MKWLREDLGSGYGQGCYGLNIFDNQMYVYIRSEVGGKARVMFSEPRLPDLKFHNFLSVLPNIKDSCYITGFPFSDERYLNGVIRYRRGLYRMRGDLPDPESYTSSYFTQYLRGHGVLVVGESSSRRLLRDAGLWRDLDRHVIVTTYSESLKDIIRTTNFFSPNLYADALLRAIGLRYVSGGNESLTSVERGVRVLKRYWDSCGISTSSLWMYDGSGLAVTNKLTARFLCAIYSYMSTCSVNASTYYSSLPRAGYEGTVRSFRLFRPALFGKIRLKSGSMSRVRCYGGYVTYGGRRYAITILINNYSGSPSFVRASIEELLSIIFR
jgi:D-alanyl-D-alanine carboxypeptidase/D-alanyl-D-alanine-endopeptidase (penicillin-binding protein 4)